MLAPDSKCILYKLGRFAFNLKKITQKMKIRYIYQNQQIQY